jgi:hypothetical protein
MIDEIRRSEVRYARPASTRSRIRPSATARSTSPSSTSGSATSTRCEFWPLAELLAKLGRFSRVIVFDKRGTGLSDPIAIDDLPTVDEWIYGG